MQHEIKNGQHISKNCMVCGIENPFSLKTQFFETTEKEVIALFTAREEHQSYPGIAHGGVSAALLDEVIGRAIMAHYDQNTFGVTVDLQVRYKKPVPLDVELKVVGRITKDRGRLYEGSGELYLPDGTVAVSAEGKYMKRNLQQITDSDFVAEEWFAPTADLPDEIEVKDQ
ncbi:MAG: PaaI family thioesterase [Deltaproteobacteria bacterium]|nr:PaaI family thioesterase [Deltaproteobacteria bacterium]MCW8893571.1 PaaI family thioesterase [Deltaproteobacteria bacterium]MCW9050476.1 PaaI family thioesterase [Deltaproteobacteria bacterium]